MSIAQKLASILEYKGDIKDAIERKGVTVGDAPLSEYSDRIDDIESPNGDLAEWKDVNFIDYDGTCILSYTAEEFLELTAMPTYPMTHPGLTFVEWNWTLSVAQNYVWKYKYLVVGASMTSSDGATRVTINIQDEDLLTVKLAFKQSKAAGTLIDWGDGNSERPSGSDFTAAANRIPHTYTQKGRYTITYTPDSDCNLSPTTGSYGGPFGYYYASYNLRITNCIESIIYGRVNGTGTNLFTSGTSLKEVAVPATIYGVYGNINFMAINLKGLVIPKFSRASTVTISNPAYGGYEMKAVSFPENATLLANNMCNGCKNVKMFTLPPNINVGANNWSNLFVGCYGAEHIVFPEGMTRIYSTTCSTCYSLKEIIIPDTVTAIGASVSSGSTFQQCLSAKKIRLSNSLTTIPSSAFNWCISLEEIIIPEGVTEIGVGAFNAPQSAKKIVLPTTVTSIGNSAFYQQYDVANQKLEAFYIKAQTPPTAGTNILQKTGVPAFTIYVPEGKLSAYQSATNWSNFASLMQEYDFTRVECKFNVTSTSSATQILNSNALSSTTSIEVDGTTISPTTTYTFSSTGEHIVKYKFTDSTKVPANAFNGCSNLVDVEFPTNVVTIDGYSFSGTGLTKVTIPKWMTTIQYNAFGSCPVLKTVVMESTTPPTMTSAFGSNATSRKFYVLKSCLSTYKEATGWSTYASDIVEMRYWGI